MHALQGLTASKATLCAHVHDVAELPASCPAMVVVEMSRSKNKATTVESEFDRRSNTARWEQELEIPVTMYSNSQGGFSDKEVKFCVKDANGGKTVCKSSVNIAGTCCNRDAL